MARAVARARVELKLTQCEFASYVSRKQTAKPFIRENKEGKLKLGCCVSREYYKIIWFYQLC